MGFDLSNIEGIIGMAGQLGSAFGIRELAALNPSSGSVVTSAQGPDQDSGIEEAGGPMVAVAGAGVALVRTLLARAAAFLGQRVTRNGAMDLIRKYGPTAAAGALGWSATEAVQFWMAAGRGGRRRRRRGISARDISNVNRVLGTFERMSARLRLPRAAGVARRRSGHKRGCGCVGCKRR